jgi:hypothetical protein
MLFSECFQSLTLLRYAYVAASEWGLLIAPHIFLKLSQRRGYCSRRIANRRPNSA